MLPHVAKLPNCIVGATLTANASIFQSHNAITSSFLCVMSIKHGKVVWKTLVGSVRLAATLKAAIDRFLCNRNQHMIYILRNRRADRPVCGYTDGQMDGRTDCRWEDECTHCQTSRHIGSSELIVFIQNIYTSWALPVTCILAESVDPQSPLLMVKVYKNNHKIVRMHNLLNF